MSAPTAPKAKVTTRQMTNDLRSRARRFSASFQTRLVLAIVLVVAISLAVTELATRQLLLSRVAERIDAELRQEVEELRVLLTGVDPATGEPFGGDAARILEVFLGTTIPSTGEAMVTFIDGEPFLRTAQRTPYRIDQDPRLVALWTGISQPLRGTAPTPAGPLEYLAVPLLNGSTTEGVFVVAVFRDLVAAEVDETVRVAGWAGLASLALGVVVAVVVARRLLVPLQRVTDASRSITDTDLSRRLEADGHDQVAELARTFNGMLDRLEAAFATKRQFLDDAGHELRTPITIIRGHLELLDHGDPSDRKATIALVLDELDRMHRIVEDLLLLARRDQPDFVQPAPTDLAELTRDVQRKAQALSDVHDFEFDAVADHVIVADRQRLTQALVQLLHNAVRHTPPGTRVSVGSDVSSGRWCVWVRDHGAGVPAAERERVFERFARGDNGRPRSEGAGLGLAIVQAIAEAHGGTVTLTSTPGGGATFTLTAPCPTT